MTSYQGCTCVTYDTGSCCGQGGECTGMQPPMVQDPCSQFRSNDNCCGCTGCGDCGCSDGCGGCGC